MGGTAPSSLLAEALSYVGFTEEDLALLRRAAPALEGHLEAMADRFYDSLLAHPRAVRAFSGEEEVARLKRTLVEWCEELLTAERDAAYEAKRLRIGKVHVERGIEPTFIVGAMGLVRRFLIARLLATGTSRDAGAIRDAGASVGGGAVVRAIEKATDVDLILMTESYHFSARLADLEEANARLRALLDAAPVAVFGWDAEGVVRDWNPAAERLFGFSRAEVVGRDALSTFVWPDDGKAAREAIGRVFSDEVVGPTHRTLRTKDGRTVRTVLAHAPIRGASGGVEEGVTFCFDVTETEALRDRMIEREKTAALGTLSAGLAHEIGNPLASISALCQLVRRRAKDETVKKQMTTVLEAVDRIRGTVRSVFDFARGGAIRDAGAGRAEEPAEVGEVVRQVLELVRLDRRLRDVKISVEVEDGLPKPNISRSSLSQVLLNLVLNAADAVREAEDAGRITIRARYADGAAQPPGGTAQPPGGTARPPGGTAQPPGGTARPSDRDLVLTVEDDGPGFSEEALARARDPFFTTKEGGTGLGLAVSHGIVERAGGRLAVSNRPEGGARVEVQLPVADDEAR